MLGTVKFLGVNNSSDTERNIMGGAKDLRQMLNLFDGDMRLSFAMYKQTQKTFANMAVCHLLKNRKAISLK